MSDQYIWETNQQERFHVFHMEFDVSRAKEIVTTCPREIVQIDISKYLVHLDKYVVVDWDRVKLGNVDRSFPIVVVTMPKGVTFPIDGWHRIAKSVMKDKYVLPGVILNEVETKAIKKEREKDSDADTGSY